DRNRGPLDGWRRSSLRDATSVVLTRMLIADRRWRKKKPIREANADRRVRERCRLSKRKSDDLPRRSKASLVPLLRGVLRLLLTWHQWITSSLPRLVRLYRPTN